MVPHPSQDKRDSSEAGSNEQEHDFNDSEANQSSEASIRPHKAMSVGPPQYQSLKNDKSNFKTAINAEQDDEFESEDMRRDI